MKPVFSADIDIIALATCLLFVIGTAVTVQLSGVKDRLDKIIEILENKP